MDFSRFIKVLDEQKAAFDKVAKEMDANGYDDICNKLNSTLSDISLVASVVPVESKKELITILKSIRVLAVDLLDLRKKFDGPEETVTKEDSISAENPSVPVADAIAPKEPAPIPEDANSTVEVAPTNETFDNVAPVGNEPSQSESQTLEKGNSKILTLTNPSLPSGNVFGQFNQAA